jgi:hypothetical protein
MLEINVALMTRHSQAGLFKVRLIFQSLLATVAGSTPVCGHHARSPRAIHRTMMSANRLELNLIADLTTKRMWLVESRGDGV